MKVYKYIDFKNGLDDIRRNRVLLDSPANYNDPFECSFEYSEKDEEICVKRIINYLFFKEYCKTINSPKIKPTIIVRWVRHEIKRFTKIMNKVCFYDKMPPFDQIINHEIKKKTKEDPEFLKNFSKLKKDEITNLRNRIKSIRNLLLISCFSDKFDSILMWSHYGKNHTGLCIEFDVDEKSYKRVKYCKKRRLFDLKTMTAIILGHDFVGKEIDLTKKKMQKIINDCIFKKSFEWKYESELRTVFNINSLNKNIEPDENGFFLKMPTIQRVYTGCRIDPGNLNSLKKEFPDLDVIELEDSKIDFEIIVKQTANPND